jgi:L-rhamnose-H+ transport protein
MTPAPITPQPFLGVGMHAVGAFTAATCYAPQKFLRRWSWETYWVTQAAWCWLIWPIVGALLTIPQLWTLLCEAEEAEVEAMLATFAIGLVYSFGAMAFNIAIRYIGFALTYAITVGFSSILGTLVPAMIEKEGGLTKLLRGPGSGWIILGLAAGVLGIAICGAAGRSKELDLQAKTGSTGEFSLVKGLLISVFAGLFSALFGCSFATAKPLIDLAAKHGAGHWEGNIVFLFVNTGAFVTTLFYCLWLGKKNSTLREYVKLPAEAGQGSLLKNHLMAFITGTFWYGQFFFMSLGMVQMGKYKYTSWAIQMILMALISNLLGVAFREWKGCRGRTLAALGLALLILVASVLLITYGNYQANPPLETKPTTS